jgi:hypothetical protein
MVEGDLKAMLGALNDLGYESHVSLELKSNIPDPLDALKRSRGIVNLLI